MSNRPSSYHSKIHFAEGPIVKRLFSKTAAPSCCDSSQSRIEARLQSASDTIDATLVDIAAEGYVLPAEQSRIPGILTEIRWAGCLYPAPSDKQSKLAITCVVPKAVVSEGKKVWWCGKGVSQSAKIYPSSAWGEKRGDKYDFVNGRK